jgi:hypothetical protein
VDIETLTTRRLVRAAGILFVVTILPQPVPCHDPDTDGFRSSSPFAFLIGGATFARNGFFAPDGASGSSCSGSCRSGLR